jgi:hypothetical protein
VLLPQIFAGSKKSILLCRQIFCSKSNGKKKGKSFLANIRIEAKLKIDKKTYT